jgi:Txe/YoeB family toxin of Txe-Axe toxin-antitoxin module
VVSTYAVRLTKQALKDLEKLRAVGLAAKAKRLCAILAEDPFQNSPPYEKLVGPMNGFYITADQRAAQIGLCARARKQGARFAHVDTLRFSDGLNYVDDCADINLYRTVFKLIFEALQQEQHYNMMMGEEGE